MKNVHLLLLIASLALVVCAVCFAASGQVHQARSLGAYSLTAAVLCYSAWPHPERVPHLRIDSRPVARQTVKTNPKEKSA